MFLKKITAHKLLTQINEQSNRLSKAKELLLTEIIDATDYYAIRKETQTSIQSLEAKLHPSTLKAVVLMAYYRKL
jgi:hypothetical protein